MSTEVQKNKIITGLWRTEKGHYYSMPVDANVVASLSTAFEQGGKFLIRNRTEDAIKNSKNPERTPTAFLEFVPKASVEEYAANRDRTPKTPQSGL